MAKAEPLHPLGTAARNWSDAALAAPVSGLSLLRPSFSYLQETCIDDVLDLRAA